MNPSDTSGAARDDANLLRRIARRDREAFSQLYDRFAGALYSTALRVLDNPDEASDVLQEVFGQLWAESPADEPGRGAPFHWALTLTRHKAIDRLRALRRRYAFFAEISGDKEAEAGEIPVAHGSVFTAGQAAHARAALARIPYEQRQAIEMAFLGGMSQSEVAEELGQSPQIISERIRRGLFRLRESLRDLI